MNIVNFFVRHQNEILQATVQHIWLVGIAMLLAVLVEALLTMFVAAVLERMGRSEGQSEMSFQGALIWSG